jgi:hypothetical protein
MGQNRSGYKGVLCLLAAFLLFSPLSKLNVHAAEQENGGTYDIKESKQVILGDISFDSSAASRKGDSGTWTWKAGPGYDSGKGVSASNNIGTLTLHNYSLSYSGIRESKGGSSPWDNKQFAVFVPAGTIVKVTGENRIENLSHGVMTTAFLSGGDVFFTGSGSLDVTDRQTAAETKSNITIGMYISGDLLSEGPDITVKSGTATVGDRVFSDYRSEAIYVSNDFLCSGGSVEAVSGPAAACPDSDSSGMIVFGSVYISGSASVTGKSDEAAYSSYGLQLQEDLKVSDRGTTEGIAGDKAEYCDGIVVSGDLSMSGKYLTAKGGNSLYNAYGLFVGGTTEFSSGTAYICSGNVIDGDTEKDGSISQACGFYSGDLKVSGGSIYTEAGRNVYYAGSEDNMGCALAGGRLEITGGRVEAVCDEEGIAVQGLDEISISSDMGITAAESAEADYSIPAAVTGNRVTYVKNGRNVQAACAVIFSNDRYSVPGTSIVLSYHIDAGGNAILTDCNEDAAGDLIIPEMIEGHRVTGIERLAFDECSSLSDIVIPSGVTMLGDGAFHDCSSIKSITFPAGVTSIGDFMFDGCNALAAIAVDKNNPKFCAIDGVLYSKDKTVLISYPMARPGSTFTIPQGVRSIAPSAFEYRTNVAEVIFPAGMTEIGEDAFRCSSLTKVKIPENITTIGDFAFEDCESLDAIEADRSNTHYCTKDGVLYSKDGKTLLCYPVGRNGDSFAIPEGVENIGSRAFAFCGSLKSVSIPSSAASIGEDAFVLCSGLTDISIPAGVKSIGDAAFYNCTGLTSIAVEAGSGTFSSSEGVLFSKDQSVLLCYPAGRKDNTYTIPAGVRTLGDRSFCFCGSLKSLSMQNSVNSIGEDAFFMCTDLTDIYYGGSKNNWNATSIDTGNTPLISATVHYNSVKK